MPRESERSLIERAMQGIRVGTCDRCGGEGEIGLPSLRATCPDCAGSSKIVINELEVGHDAQS